MPVPMSLPIRVTPTRLVATVAAAAVACGVALAAWATDDATPPPGPLAHHHAQGMPGLMLPRGPLLDHLLDQVEATSPQRSRIHHLIDTAAATRLADRAADRADHDLLLQLFAQPQVDPAALEAVRQRLQARQEAASRTGLQALLDVGAVLDPGQRARLVALVREARARHHPPVDGGPEGAPPAPANR